MRNKYAVVTGASTGIGRAIALALAKTGIFVILIARTKERLEETLRMVRQEGGDGKMVIADLSKIDSVNACISEIKKETTTIDSLVNVAGIWHGEHEVFAGRDFHTFPQQVILDTYAVGTIAPTLLAHALIPLMPTGSNIVNISGTFENGAKGWLPYFVSKRAIEDLTIGLSEELKEKNIYVNAISPSDTATEAYKYYFEEDAKGAQTPEEIAIVAVELMKKNVTGKIFILKKGKIIQDGFHK